MRTLAAILHSVNRLTVAIVLNVLIMLLLIYINIQTGILYENSHGKNRALFGWFELIRFGYKYWLLVPGSFALILGLTDWHKRGGKKAILTSLLSLFTCGLIFVRLWLLWVSHSS
jgi:hypothetical protein